MLLARTQERLAAVFQVLVKGKPKILLEHPSCRCFRSRVLQPPEKGSYQYQVRARPRIQELEE